MRKQVILSLKLGIVGLLLVACTGYVYASSTSSLSFDYTAESSMIGETMDISTSGGFDVIVDAKLTANNKGLFTILDANNKSVMYVYLNSSNVPVIRLYSAPDVIMGTYTGNAGEILTNGNHRWRISRDGLNLFLSIDGKTPATFVLPSYGFQSTKFKISTLGEVSFFKIQSFSGVIANEYLLDEGTGSVANDSSGNLRHATINKPVWVNAPPPPPPPPPITVNGEYITNFFVVCFILPLLFAVMFSFILALFMEIANIMLNIPRYVWGEKEINFFD